MLKKTILFLLLIALNLSACSMPGKEIEYTGSDLALYNAAGQIITNLYAEESEIDYNDPIITQYLTEMQIDFEEINDKANISYISYIGGLNPVITGRGIKVYGSGSSDTSKAGTAEDIIKEYGINTKKEEVYYNGSNDSEIYVIALYFNVSNDGIIERVKSPKGSDISNFESMDANAYIYYTIQTDNVIGVTLCHKPQQ